jgi:hypothetical protein
MNRRKVLAFALVALLAAAAGCSGEGSLRMDPVDDDSLADQASSDLDTLQPGQDRELVRDAIQNGTTTAVDDRPPVDQQQIFSYEGAFYDISYTEAGTQQGYVAELRVDYNASTVEGEVIDYADLSAVDQRAVDPLLDRPEPPEEALEPGYEFEVVGTYTENQTDSSVLVPEQEYDAVRYEGETYPVGVEAFAETLTVYQYNSTVVAENAAEYATELREQYEFELSGLSENERSVVEDALNDTNYIDDSDNSGFDSLVERFQSHQAVEETDDTGKYIVRYDGQVHWVEVDYGSYLDDEE